MIKFPLFLTAIIMTTILSFLIIGVIELIKDRDESYELFFGLAMICLCILLMIIVWGGVFA